MGKLFQNGVESEIVAGYFNNQSLSGLYLNGNYFSFKKKLTIYHGFLINEDPNKMYASQAFTDADILSQITSNAFTSETVASNMLPGKIITYTTTSREENAAGYSFAVYAYPAILGDLTAYDNNDDDPTPIELTGNGLFDGRKQITIDDVVYNVYIEASGEYREAGQSIVFRFMK